MGQDGIHKGGSRKGYRLFLIMFSALERVIPSPFEGRVREGGFKARPFFYIVSEFDYAILLSIKRPNCFELVRCVE